MDTSYVNQSEQGLESAGNSTPSNVPPSYPMKSYLNFCPGGVSYDEDEADEHFYQLSDYSQTPPGSSNTNSPGTPRSQQRRTNLSSGERPDSIVYKAKVADDRLRLYTLLSGGRDTSLPFFLPSLSVLAHSAFGRLTGVPPTAAKTWADAMVLQFLDNSEYEYPKIVSMLANEGDIKNAELPRRQVFPATETTANVLRRLLQQAEASQSTQSAGAGGTYRSRPCGYVFKRGDIAWNCRTCQTDSTCVICDTCFRNSNHEGHEVFFHRTTPGGCCDCGDAEAWKVEGCCDAHRPQTDETVETVSEDPDEAARMAAKGLKEGIDTLKYPPTALPPKFAAALGAVIGAAVQCLVQAVDGAGIGADPVQWKLRWSDEASRIWNSANNNEEYVMNKSSPATAGGVTTPLGFLGTGSDTVKELPQNYRFHLRLHNDDVHTFDEVIEALHEPRHSRRSQANPDDPQNQSLIPLREAANEMTHHVDADGQVTVKTYSSIGTALQGFRRLKSRGLHCAVVSTAQVDIEQRARALSTWLAEISAAHPAAAVIVVHALVQVGAGDEIGEVPVWRKPRTIPAWAGGGKEDETSLSRKFSAFPPHLASSYLTSEEAEKLHGLSLRIDMTTFKEITGASVSFYGRVPYRLPSERYKKSPHALWGTLPGVYIDQVPVQDKHPLLKRLSTKEGAADVAGIRNGLTESVYVVDTDLRKQQEADRITSTIFPHRLPGLHLISGTGTIRVKDLSQENPPLPDSMKLRHLLAMSSFRAPISPIILLLLLDPYPTKQLRGAIHALFLSLLTDARFKCRFAAALGVAYRPLSTLFCAGVGTEADTPLGFTVQIFTAGSLVRALGNAPSVEKLLLPDDEDYSIEESSVGVFTMPIALTVVRCIHTNLLGATKEVHMILNNTPTGNDVDSDDNYVQNTNDSLLPALTYVAGEHPLMTSLPAAPDDGFLDSRSTRHKRLPHLLRDLEYVIETPGTAMRLLLPKRFPAYQGAALSSRGEEILTFSTVWSRLLRLAQGMDPQKRKISGGHVEYEQNRWLEGFGLSLNFAGTRDALAESPTNSSSATLAPVSEDGSHLVSIREAMGNVIGALLREIKLWLYREGMLETGLPMPPGGAHGASDLSQVEALQRSTLHVSASQLSSSGEGQTSPTSNVSTVALSCATTVKMTEAQLDLIESALRVEGKERQLQGGNKNRVASGAVISDWLRVPHSPLAGDSLSFHLPLHRALAKSVRSMCGVVVPEVIRQNNAKNWWKLPVLDDDVNDLSGSPIHHPLVPLIRPILRSSNCRVVWSAGPDCSAQEANRRRNRAKSVSANIAVAKIIHSIADHPIRCLAASQQVERHLWARNGSSTAGMALNYSNAPLCRSFRDLDLTLVQLSASGMSVGLGASRVFSLLISRFSLDGYLCDPERRGIAGSGNSSYAAGLGTWVNPPRLNDPEHAIILSESFFSTLCVLVSELPPPPPISSSDETWLRQSIRRELIHALAAEPRSHSSAIAAASCAVGRRDESDGSAGTSGGGGLFRDVFASVLREVGKQKSQGSRAGSGPSSFELNASCCDEYDPTFFHLRRQEHQHAMDVVASLRKQKLGKEKSTESLPDAHCLPLVCSPPKAHPRFIPCRLMLHLNPMDAAIRRALLFALFAGSWLPPSEPVAKVDDDENADDDTPMGGVSVSTSTTGDVPTMTFSRRSYGAGAATSNPFTKRGSSLENEPPAPFSAEVVASSSVSFIEVLQLLTLQVHTLEECASLHRVQEDLDDEARNISASLSINSYLGRLVRVPESLEDVWALRPFPEGPLKSNGSGQKRGSMLGLLIALYEHRADHVVGGEDGQDQGAEGHGGARSLAASGLKWLLRFVHALVEGAPSVAAAVRSATTGVAIGGSASSQTLRSESGATIWTIDRDVKSTTSGMLSNLSDLWPKALDASLEKKTNSDKKNKERGKAAQQKMLEMMRRKQSAFVASMGPSDEKQEDKKEPSEEADLCIICRCDDADGENNGPLGYLGHVQRSRISQMRACHESVSKVNEGLDTNPLFNRYRVVGHMGCQVRESEAMDSQPVSCLPRGTIVTLVKGTVSDKYDILSRRVLVKHVAADTGTVTEGWASVQSSQGYVILSPLVSLCYENTRWGSTRPIVRQCGHAAHLRCVETHALSLHQRAAGDQPYDGRFAANINDGEFLCPLCKQLSNILIPRDGCSRETDISVPAKAGEKSELNSEESLRRLFTRGTRVNAEILDSMSKMGRKALEGYGSNLMRAMEVPWERTASGRKRKQRRWHPSIQRWDYEERDDDPSLLGASTSVKNTLRLLRQQLIAWAAVGHSAAVSEASVRGIEEVLPFGSFSKIDEPWPGYQKDKETEPMLLELARTMAGASGLLEVLIVEMAQQLMQEEMFVDDAGVSIVGRCLADIILGRDWTQGISAAMKGSASKIDVDGLILWSQLSSLTTSMPCHVARDGMISQRHEARAAAAAMWTVRGVGSSSSNSGDPPMPLAVAQAFELSSTQPPNIAAGWGSMTPVVSPEASTIFDYQPFRPAVASAYLYTPLLSWDLNTLAGALFSSALVCSPADLPNSEDLLRLGSTLLTGRIIQVLITPHGFDSLEKMEMDEEDEEGRWAPGEIEKEGQALAKMFGHCRARIDSDSMNSDCNLLSGSTVSSPFNLFCSVGRGILPFARSLILLMRACHSAIKSRRKKLGEQERKDADGVLEELLDGSETLTTGDGFFIAKQMHGSLPTGLIDPNEPWFQLINRWLTAVIALEKHHGSVGDSVIPEVTQTEAQQRKSSNKVSDNSAKPADDTTAQKMRKSIEDEHQSGEEDTSDMQMEQGPEDQEDDAHNAEAGEGNGLYAAAIVEEHFESDEDLIEDMEMDEAEEMVDFADQILGTAGFTGVSNSAPSHEPEDSADEPSSSGSEDGDVQNSSHVFAGLAESPIVSYQPSVLATRSIGPGRQGSLFESRPASDVMADLSHLGLTHRKDVPTFCLIRLPKSFVELYGIVNKVKGRDESATLEESDDVGNSETAICLLTGAVMRSGSSRRPFQRSQRPPGACTLHARKNGSGIGIFFLVQKCTVLLMHNNKSAYSASLYVDEHGEEDPGLRRGRPLFLNGARYSALESLWRQQGIPREVAQIRSTSDRVIRDNWY